MKKYKEHDFRTVKTEADSGEVQMKEEREKKTSTFPDRAANTTTFQLFDD